MGRAEVIKEKKMKTIAELEQPDQEPLEGAPRTGEEDVTPTVRKKIQLMKRTKMNSQLLLERARKIEVKRGTRRTMSKLTRRTKRRLQTARRTKTATKKLTPMTRVRTKMLSPDRTEKTRRRVKAGVGRVNLMMKMKKAVRKVAKRTRICQVKKKKVHRLVKTTRMRKRLPKLRTY